MARIMCNSFWKKENLRAGRNCTWASVANTFDKFVAETLGVAGGQKTNAEAWQRGSSHNFLASMDMKIALDETRPMHVEIMEGRNVHGWIIAAFLARYG